MITKHLLYCKKTYIVKNLGFEVGRIEKNKTYHYYVDSNSTYNNGVCIFVYYDEYNTHEGRRGYTFYYNLNIINVPKGVDIKLISDYFYSDVELRKIKLTKINEQSKMF